MIAPAPILQRGPISTCGPITALGATIVPAPISAPCSTTAVGWMMAGSGSMAMTSVPSATIWSWT